MDERQQHQAARQARRDFLRAAGLGGAALALAACGTGAESRPEPTGPLAAVTNANGVTLDFANEVDVLNYAYALEQLEAAFYARVTSDPNFGAAFAPNERRVLSDLTAHEAIHREFLKAAIPAGARIPSLAVDFGGIDFGSRASVLAAARDFEDLGVTAYNGAARYIKTSAYLTLAGKIVSVEARHASAIRDLLQPRTGAFAPADFDGARTPEEVLAAAGAYIVGTITVKNT